MIKLGQTVEDKVTGFTGIITARCEYITGCTQFLLQPELNKNGEFVESRWLDDSRLKITNKKRMILQPDEVAEEAGIDGPEDNVVPFNGPDKPAPRR